MYQKISQMINDVDRKLKLKWDSKEEEDFIESNVLTTSMPMHFIRNTDHNNPSSTVPSLKLIKRHQKEFQTLYKIYVRQHRFFCNWKKDTSYRMKVLKKTIEKQKPKSYFKRR